MSVEGFAYAPATVRVPVGATITWVARDAAGHTVTARDTSWGSALLRQGQEYARTFTEEGVCPYFCELHPWMHGTVVVGDAPEPKAQSEGDASPLETMRRHTEGMHGPGAFEVMRRWMERAMGSGALETVPCHRSAPAAPDTIPSPRPGRGTMGMGGMMGR